ncbi:NAD-dependent epimerase/dehydratase family protein [Vibrio vulnificus]|uniref:NAD-dependent epimerase/dehydratase family protein n=1 Tax=Vibrio vulnificus TaxID=672 RepID=UPI001CDD2B15|nr:NAD-dependent epimerase/dehydratase family protein [Vibrio vulnificus]MCA3950709.1 NAD-dependent epimerase/dehydratase family protein [Vibrio vulnificus]
MYIVTGGAGFIGRNLVKALNEINIKDIIIVDSLSVPNKFKNLDGLYFSDFINYKSPSFKCDIKKLNKIKVVFHIGANADVLISNCDQFMEENFNDSKIWYEFCEERNIPLIYASSSAVYGNGKHFKVTFSNEKPHNEYAFSKLAFDKFVNSREESRKFQCVGYRFFNVFGPGEGLKGKNASLINRFYNFAKNAGKIDLFDKEISRDYVYVKDLCEVLIHTYFDNSIRGVFNLGSGRAWSHESISNIVVNTMRKSGLIIDEEPVIKIPMPEQLLKKFQYYTIAQDLPEHVVKFISDTENRMVEYVEFLIKEDEIES